MVADKTCAIVIQILRENARAKPGAVMRMLEQRRKRDADQEIVLPSMGSLKNLIVFLKKHEIPDHLNAASCGAFYKKFGIRIGHGWKYSNQSWGTDAAHLRISCCWELPHRSSDCKNAAILLSAEDLAEIETSLSNQK